MSAAAAGEGDDPAGGREALGKAARRRWRPKPRGGWKRALACWLLPLRTSLLFCGDSHLAPIWKGYKAGLFGTRHARCVLVAGATARGLGNPRSATGARQKYLEALLPPAPRVIPVFLLGEVDCNSVIWLRSTAAGTDPADELARSVTVYLSFLEEVLAAGYRRILVLAAPLPTVEGSDHHRAHSILRRDITATLRERTALTRRFNQAVAEGCRLRGIDFLDLTAAWADPATGLVADRFRASDPLDHHLDEEAAAPVWVAAIRRALR
jgi:hypothetical protein